MPERDWSECLSFSRAVADALVRERPRAYTTEFPKAGRERKILLDYLRNNRPNTSVAAFSTRARAEATVSVPLAWEELTARLRSDRYTVRNVVGRLRSLRKDPRHAYWRARQRIPAKALDALAAG